jgi:hypothetical protein
MTIKLTRIESPNLFAQNESLQFDLDRAQQLAKSIPHIGAISYTASDPEASNDLTSLTDACAITVCNTLFEGKIATTHKTQMLIASGSWLTPSPVTEHRKLWKSRKNILDAINPPQPTKEICFHRDNKIRYASILPIKHSSFAASAQIARKIGSCAIFASRHDEPSTERVIKATFQAAFPELYGTKTTNVDWLGLAIHLCPVGDILLRVSGLFDDRDACIDLIADPELLETL